MRCDNIITNIPSDSDGIGRVGVKLNVGFGSMYHPNAHTLIVQSLKTVFWVMLSPAKVTKFFSCESS